MNLNLKTFACKFITVFCKKKMVINLNERDNAFYQRFEHFFYGNFPTIPFNLTGIFLIVCHTGQGKVVRVPHETFHFFFLMFKVRMFYVFVYQLNKKLPSRKKIDRRRFGLKYVMVIIKKTMSLV